MARVNLASRVEAACCGELASPAIQIQGLENPAGGKGLVKSIRGGVEGTLPLSRPRHCATQYGRCTTPCLWPGLFLQPGEHIFLTNAWNRCTSIRLLLCSARRSEQN